MSYTHERDEFIARATAEGLGLDVCRKLLRYATTLQRLQEAQCNGDWPYNGDRDRPSPVESKCTYCKDGKVSTPGMLDHLYITADCDKCNGTGTRWARDMKADERHDRRYTVCPKCETSGVAKSAMRKSSEKSWRLGDPVCPDCRTQELVTALLAANDPGCTCGTEDKYQAIFQGDPRGAVLKLATPKYPWSDDGVKGYGLYVPARGTR